MKAKEIAQFSVHATRHSEVARDTIEEMIVEYAKAKCEEQRTLCANYYRIRTPNEKNNGTTLFEDIKNAPEPDFE